MATLAGTPLQLTAKEFELLAYLARHAGKVCTHHMILKDVWGPGYGAESNYVRVYTHRLRKKMGDEEGRLLKTVPGIGYQLVARRSVLGLRTSRAGSESRHAPATRPGVPSCDQPSSRNEAGHRGAPDEAEHDDRPFRRLISTSVRTQGSRNDATESDLPAPPCSGGAARPPRWRSRSLRDLGQCLVELQHVDVGGPQEAEFGALGLADDQTA